MGQAKGLDRDSPDFATTRSCQPTEAEADRRGLSAEVYAAKLLDQHLPPLDAQAAVDTWYAQWMAEAAVATPEDEATAEAFFQALDEDRPSIRKLFPDELKGVTW